jgi:hypothetical protein
MLIDPTSSYARAAAAAIGRAMDDVIIDALGGTAKTGKEGTTSTSFPAGQKIAHGSAGLTIAKLVEAKKKLDANSVDPSIKRYIVVSPEQIEDLLNSTTVTSSDFNTVNTLPIWSATVRRKPLKFGEGLTANPEPSPAMGRCRDLTGGISLRWRESPAHERRKPAAKAEVWRKALVQGDINTFVGFEFIVSNRLSDDGTSRLCYAWAQDGCKLAVGKDVMARIDERSDKSYSTQVYYCATFGATRMEEDKVVEIACNE